MSSDERANRELIDIWMTAGKAGDAANGAWARPIW